ncbi:MAG TPA: ATP-binding protein [Polyangiaceae bacterium]
MAVFGRIRRRLALALGLTALIPVLAAIWLVESTVRQTSARFFVPEVGERLDQSLGLYQELARAVKATMRQEAATIAENAELRRLSRGDDREALAQRLERLLAEHPRLVSLSVESAVAGELARVERARPLNPEREHQLVVARPLQAYATSADAGAGPGAREEVTLEATFATEKARFAGLESMSQFVDTYKQIERRREADEATYVLAFSLLLGITVVAAIFVGTLFARAVVSRIDALAEATRRVASGDLTVRVPERGADELADLARAFNRMLEEVESSRARLEYLRRIGAWQEMARRLAHEIKNPLTPIQLAVQEVHRRYDGASSEYRRLLDTTLEIVEDEVATLRRLVSEFSGFARLPQARLEPSDLAQLLREQAERTEMAEEEESSAAGEAVALSQESLRFEIPEGSAPALLDRQMMRRVLVNLIANAAQATRQTPVLEGGESGAASATAPRPVVVVRLSREGDFYNLDVDDNGPGFPDELRDTVFDPYVTTKPDGTGLGLAIVKKTVVEHGGAVLATKSPLGGARVRVRLPVRDSAASRAALEAEGFRQGPASAKPTSLVPETRAVTHRHEA